MQTLVGDIRANGAKNLVVVDALAVDVLSATGETAREAAEPESVDLISRPGSSHNPERTRNFRAADSLQEQ